MLSRVITYHHKIIVSQQYYHLPTFAVYQGLSSGCSLYMCCEEQEMLLHDLQIEHVARVSHVVHLKN